MQETKLVNENTKAQMQVWMDCHKACIDTMNYCLQRGEHYKDLSLLCNLRDCAEMSLMCANLMMDGSEFMGRTALLCAEMCEKCVRVCEMLNHDLQIARFMKICRQCANHSKMMGTHASSYFHRDAVITEQSLLECALA